MRTTNSFWRGALLTLLFFTGVSQLFRAHAQTSDNQPPLVRVAEPHDGAAFAAGADITLWATASDSDGWVKTVEFFANGTSLGITTNNPLAMSPINPFHLTWHNVAVGEYALTARATDNGGASAVSEAVHIKVMDANVIPVVTISVPDNIAREQSPLVDAAPDLARFVVHRTCNLNDKLIVHYRVSGTAENGVDYVKLSGEVEIPVGSATAEIIVNALDDLLVEGSETVVVTIEPPPCTPSLPPAPGCYLVGRVREAVAFILDNEEQPNRPPHISILSPPNGAVFLAPTDIRIIANTGDVDGWVQQVEFFDGTDSLGVVSNHFPIFDPVLDPSRPEIDPIWGPFNIVPFVWSNAPPGAHVLTAVATDNRGASTISAPANITIFEMPGQPVVTVKATDPEASEGSLDPTTDAAPDTATFTIHRTGDTDFPITVYYRLSGSAQNGVDYRELPSTVVIPEGARSVDVVVNPIDDNLAEGAEIVVLTIQPPACITIFPPPRDCYLVGRCHEARAVIYDNDVPANHPPFVRMVEPLDGQVFLAGADIHLVAAAWDSDGEVKSVEFFEGANSLGFGTPLPQPLSPCPINGMCWYPPTYGLVWSNVPPGHYVLTAVATDDDNAATISRPVEIRVVDIKLPPVVSIMTVDGEAQEQLPTGAPIPSNDARFRVTRTGPTDASLIVYYKLGGTAENGKDYQELSGRVEIAAGHESVDIVVRAMDDLLCEGTETVIAEILPPVCLPIFPPPRECYIVGSNSRAQAVILDNEACEPNLPPRVELSHPPDGSVFIAPADIIVGANAFDPDGTIKKVEFFAGDHKIGETDVPIRTPFGIYIIFWEDVPPGNYVLTAKATDNQDASTVSDPVRIKVVESPVPVVVTLEVKDAIATEGGINVGPPGSDAPVIMDPAVFTVHRSGPTDGALDVFYRVGGSSSNGEDYARLSGKVTIPAGSRSADIVVDPLEDERVEGTETVVVTLLPNCNATDPALGACYIVGDPGHGTAYIRDNDLPPNLAPRVEIARPHNGAAFVAPANIEITAIARDPDGWVPKVEFFAGDRKIGEAEIVFIQPPPPGETQTFSIIWSNVPPGSHVLTARATDNMGATSQSEPIRIFVFESGAVPIVTIEAKDPVASEPGVLAVIDDAVFVVHRTGSLNNPLQVYYLIGGTAENGADYRRLGGEVVIPEGKASAEIVVHALDDDLVEETETVVIELNPGCNPGLDPQGCAALNTYLVGEPSRAVARILDTDPHPNQPPKVEIARPHSGEVFQAPAEILIVAAARDPDGWVPLVEFFANGVKIGEQRVDFIQEPPPGQLQEFEFKWMNVPPGQYILTAKATDNMGASTRSGPVVITVLEAQHPPIVTIRSVDCLAIEGTPPNTASFRVRRTGPTNEALLVFYSVNGTASNGVDYEMLAGTVTIPAGKRTARITVTPKDDDVIERIETVIVKLEPSPTLGPIEPYHVGYPRRAGAIIVDNDQPRPPTLCLPDGVFHLCFPGDNGFTYRIEGSANLVDWEPLSDGLVVDGAVHYLDADTPDFPHRFYRVRAAVELAVEADD